MDSYNDNPFISNNDIQELLIRGVEYHKDVKIFLQEMRLFINMVWLDDYYIEPEINTIDALNIYLDYPSINGYNILTNLFDKKDLPIELFSRNSLILLHYCYNINMLNLYLNNDELNDEGFN